MCKKYYKTFLCHEYFWCEERVPYSIDISNSLDDCDFHKTKCKYFNTNLLYLFFDNEEITENQLAHGSELHKKWPRHSAFT